MSQSTRVDRNSCELKGFVDLGNYTTKENEKQVGDHALVFMFQPYRGKWIQALACFLTKGSITGNLLEHLLLECIILLENSGFHVDTVTSDGNACNRKTWTNFGINTEETSSEHPVDPDRRLWFVSDFPHLIKNLRNFLVKHKELNVR